MRLVSVEPDMTHVTDYERWLTAQGMSRNTINQRVQFARARWRAWGTWHVPPDKIAEYLSGYQGWSRRTYHAHLSSIYDWLLERGEVSTNPCDRIRPTPAPHARPMPLTAREVSTVLLHATGDLHTWLQLARLAGLRCHEIAKLRGEDVSEQRIYVLGKGGHGEVVPTHPELWRIAQDYPRVGWWFPTCSASGHVRETTVSSRTRVLFREHGITRSIHRLRANYGTDLLRSGANISVVQSLMRHTSLSSTQHYLASDEDERVAAIRGLAA